MSGIRYAGSMGSAVRVGQAQMISPNLDNTREHQCCLDIQAGKVTTACMGPERANQVCAAYGIRLPRYNGSHARLM